MLTQKAIPPAQAAGDEKEKLWFECDFWSDDTMSSYFRRDLN